MAIIDDPGVPVPALFKGRDAYVKSAGCELAGMGDDALDAVAAAIEGAAPDLRAQGAQIEAQRIVAGLRFQLGKLRSYEPPFDTGLNAEEIAGYLSDRLTELTGIPE